MSMESIMFVITHKKTSIPNINGNRTLLVGANKASQVVVESLFDFCDNTGENISDKNNSYCELTGLYWIWKNVDCENVGVCHYRRFFTKYMFSNSSSGFYTDTDIEKELITYDVIIPRRYYYSRSVLESVNIAPNTKDIEEMRRAIIELSPDYIEPFEAFLAGGESCLYNMCIMKKKLFDDYCKWLFNILAYIEKNHDMSVEDNYRARLFGFLSERLLYVWLRKNIDQRRIKEVRVVKTDESSFRSLLHEGKNLLRKIQYVARKV